MPEEKARNFRSPGPVFVLAVALLAVILTLLLGRSHGAEPTGEQVGNGTPVILILLDEFPTASLMTPDGEQIDSRRFPRIAHFASGATWYRDHVAGGDFTGWAVPSILAGKLGSRRMLPTAEVFPDNIFTVLGPARQVHSFETVTELCPVEICPDGNQGEAPDAQFANEFVKAKFRPYSAAEISRWINGMPVGENTLSFVHLKLPHLPLQFTPDSHRYFGGTLLMPNNLFVKHWVAGESAISFIQHRHLWQAGYADRIVGQILQQIRRNGDFDQAMIVITADHGVSFDRDDLRRDATDTNKGATLNPPLIIKYPDQQFGEISTAPTQAIDIYPTIAQELGADIPPTEGRPVSEATPGRVMTVSKDLMSRIEVTADEIRSDREEVLAMQSRRLGDRGLWALGPRSQLIGRPAPRVTALPGPRAILDAPAAIRNADASSQLVPALVAGRLRKIAPGKILALAWNGRIVATTRSFRYRGQSRFGAMVPPSVMSRGANRIRLYRVGQTNRLRQIRCFHRICAKPAPKRGSKRKRR